MISAYILAYNEEKKIGKTLESITWVDEIVVIDSFSKDRTVEIAESYGAKVVQVDFSGFGKLREAGIANTTHEWIFSIDSDEQCTPEAKEEILRVTQDPNSKDAYMMPRLNTFMGKPIRHSGWYPNYRQPQLFRRGKVTYNAEDLVHERWTEHGTLGHLKKPITQLPYRNLSELMEKANRYSTLGADKLKEKGKKGSIPKAFTHGLWAFIRLYVIRLGILDGWPGLVIAIANFEGTFYRYAKLTEIQRKEREGEL